ncbi:MAG: acylphosphatase [Candidatus Nanoarchaeia archaeon]|nr:acylphosphatase [Candidatus Nanoarchaeia archaeon]
MKTLRVYISGAVQGLFFRKFLEEQANRIGVRGFVRNLEDGRVEIVIEGREDKVNEMLKACQGEGYSHANVKDIKIEELKYQGFEGFKITRL